MNNLETNCKPSIPLYTVQLIGKVSGMDYEQACALFKVYQFRLEAKGYTVINPCELVQPGTEWHEAMRICLNSITGNKVYNIFRLPNWWHSKGAWVECFVAKITGLKVIKL